MPFRNCNQQKFYPSSRMYRPSNRIRALVSHEPEYYRGSNHNDPGLMWMGLGKQKKTTKIKI